MDQPLMLIAFVNSFRGAADLALYFWEKFFFPTQMYPDIGWSRAKRAELDRVKLPRIVREFSGGTRCVTTMEMSCGKSAQRTRSEQCREPCTKFAVSAKSGAIRRDTSSLHQETIGMESDSIWTRLLYSIGTASNKVRSFLV